MLTTTSRMPAALTTVVRPMERDVSCIDDPFSSCVTCYTGSLHNYSSWCYSRDPIMAVLQNARTTNETLRRAVVASTIGTVIEWFDYALYVAAAGLIIN